MSQHRTFIVQNSIFGAFVGISFILSTYLFFLSGQSVSMNPQLGNVIMLLSVAGGFIGTRKYREEQLSGIISYGKALGCSLYILGIASALYSIFIYLLYANQPELLENYLKISIALLEEVYKGMPQLESMKAIMNSLITSGFIAFTEFLNKLLTGFMFSLLLAFILRRKARNNYLA